MPLTSGIESLDRELGGGIPTGSIVVLYAPPVSQSELILEEIIEERNTLYISVERTEPDVRDSFEHNHLSNDNVVIRHPGLDSPLGNARDALRQVTNQANIIIDTTELLENDKDETRYIKFLNELTSQLKNTDSIAFLHVPKSKNETSVRETTLKMADVILDLDVDTSGDEVENRLAVPKFRNGSAPKDTIKLELEDEVEVDTSRDIA